MIALGLVPLGVALGLAVAGGIGVLLVGFALVLAVVIIGVKHPWGAAVCLAPVYLFPVTTMTTLPSAGFLHWRFILAVASVGLATSYWRLGAKHPKLNPWSFASVGFLGVALVVLGRRNGISLQESLSLPLFACTGLLVGQCLQRPAAIRALACLATPLAALALFEAAGLHGLWASLLHADAYEGLSSAGTGIRSSSSFGHPLIAGACLTATGLVLLSIRERATTIAGTICIVGAATTVSRSALLGAALGIIIFALQMRGRRVRIIAAAIVLVLVALLVISSVPELRHSFDTRILDLKQGQLSQEETVRENSLSIVKNEFNVDPGRLLIGGGVGYSGKLLEARGGNAAGYDIFDNEYITMLYDGGLVIVLIVFALLALATVKASRYSRRQALPALAAVALMMYFVDGMEWPSLSVVAWIAIGLFTVPIATSGGVRSGPALGESP